MRQFPAKKLLEAMLMVDRADWGADGPTGALRRYQVLWDTVRAQGPSRIVEIGVRAGYSAWTMLDACPRASLIGFDFDGDERIENTYMGYRGAWHHAERILFGKQAHIILANSHNIQRLPECDLLYIDGDHTEDGVMQDLLLAERSEVATILLDDYTTTNLGIRPAVTEFLSTRPELKSELFENGSTGLFVIWR